MSEEYLDTEEVEGGNNTTIIIIVVVAVLLLCCCVVAFGVGGWFLGDPVMEALEISL